MLFGEICLNGYIRENREMMVITKVRIVVASREGGIVVEAKYMGKLLECRHVHFLTWMVVYIDIYNFSITIYIFLYTLEYIQCTSQ